MTLGRRAVWLAIGLAGAAGCGAPPRQAILITIDSLRDDHVGAQADRVSLAPALDGLQADGVRFTDTLTSATTTMASHASMLTGLRPHRHGLAGNDGALAATVATVEGLLRARGVRTGAVVSSFVLRSEGGLAAGFESYDESFDSQESSRVGQRVKTPAATTRAAMAFVRQHRREPFFLWVHYFPPHGPYVPPEEFLTTGAVGSDAEPALPISKENYERGKLPKYQRIEGVSSARQYRERYAAHVRYVDQHVGRLLAGLREMEVYDTALVIGTADHGESLGEHDWYFCHGNLVYQEQARVPLLVKWQRARRLAGRRCATPVELVDVAPTVLSFFGIAPPADLDGQDLARSLDGPHAALDRVRIVQSTDGELTAVVIGPAKLTQRRAPARLVNDQHPREELFRLDRDAGEAHDVSPEEPALVRTLRDLVPRCRQPVRQQGLSSETLERLRSLGYVVRETMGAPCGATPEEAPRGR